MIIAEVDSLDGLLSIIDEWRGLWLECTLAPPFLSPEWLVPWWKSFGGGRLCVLAARDGARLVGLAPLFVYKTKDNERSLAFIGTGISDYLGVLSAPGFETGFAGAVLRWITGESRSWDTCRLEEIREGSPILDIRPPAGYAASISLQSTCPALSLPDSAKAFQRLLSNDFRRKIAKGKRDIEGAGRVEVEDAETEAVPGFISELFALHGERLGVDGAEIERLKAFHLEAAKGLSMLGCLSLKRLLFNGEPASVLYTFKKGERLYCYMTAFDERLSRYSPGRYLMARAVEDAIGAGLRVFDLMRGAEPYKYAWSANDAFNYRLNILKQI